MTAYAGDAMSHALLSALLRAVQRLFCVPKIAIRIAGLRAAVFIRKNRSIGHCMAAMGISSGTESADPFH